MNYSKTFWFTYADFTRGCMRGFVLMICRYAASFPNQQRGKESTHTNVPYHTTKPVPYSSNQPTKRKETTLSCAPMFHTLQCPCPILFNGLLPVLTHTRTHTHVGCTITTRCESVQLLVSLGSCRLTVWMRDGME